ncbi:hypothetical protein Pan14r_16140 [Crateriforma conspicua]|uniref:Uncharacterized protein n=1 Tax=Crateriforma conspicua TaxID=2527996 RepID=A0A5C5Y3E8_9PLAN|nr:hypothetical protein Mal65_31140 [Crateriforma conspicua]TWT69329.1 hypothetical protein Pan14r_16140 [Crateriforma conspicua]
MPRVKATSLPTARLAPTGGLLSAILIAQVALIWDAIDQASPIPDEFGLLVGGLDSIVNGRHDIDCVNPPLVKRLAAWIPVGRGFRIPSYTENPDRRRIEWDLGRRRWDR